MAEVATKVTGGRESEVGGASAAKVNGADSYPNNDDNFGNMVEVSGGIGKGGTGSLLVEE